MSRSELFDVSTLGDLNASALRQVWRQQLGADPPPLRAPEVLRRELAARLQVRVHGSLDPALRQRLDRLAQRLEHAPKPKAAARRPPTGSALIKHWNGVEHSVVVLTQGFLYRGQTYRSLSQIARLITGVRWSGPRFFGLRP